MNYVKDLSDKANEIIEAQWSVTPFEALQIAVQIQRNELYAQANVLNTVRLVPSALEKIGMELESLNNTIAEGVDITNHTVS